MFAAVSDQGTNKILVVGWIFMSIWLLLSAKIQGYSSPMSNYPLLMCLASLVGNWEANSLSCIKFFIDK
jgi:hypothetical protein